MALLTARLLAPDPRRARGGRLRSGDAARSPGRSGPRGGDRWLQKPINTNGGSWWDAFLGLVMVTPFDGALKKSRLIAFFDLSQKLGLGQPHFDQPHWWQFRQAPSFVTPGWPHCGQSMPRAPAGTAMSATWW